MNKKLPRHYYIHKTIVLTAFILFYLFFYIELSLNVLGRETGIIWLCGNLILVYLPFYCMEKRCKNPEGVV